MKEPVATDDLWASYIREFAVDVTGHSVRIGLIAHEAGEELEYALEFEGVLHLEMNYLNPDAEETPIELTALYVKPAPEGMFRVTLALWAEDQTICVDCRKYQAYRLR